jgi:hypothetical protein
MRREQFPPDFLTCCHWFREIGRSNDPPERLILH